MSDELEVAKLAIKTAERWGLDCGETAMIQTAALKAIVQRVERLEGVLSYLRAQARNGTLHPQIVIQNVNAAFSPEPIP